MRLTSRISHPIWCRLLSSTSQVSNLAKCRQMPANEPILDYSHPNSKHRLELEERIRELQETVQDIPIVIGGKEFTSDEVHQQLVPFNHQQVLAHFYYAPNELIQRACQKAFEAKRDWSTVRLDDRVKIFEKAADLVSGKYRQLLNAATMLGQAKTAKQAEIDSAAELADFLRMNAWFAGQIDQFGWQPRSVEFEDNKLELASRGLDGIVAAISPFNFTAIGANLASAPALMGNGVVWKPSDTAVLANYISFKVLMEAGLPEGLINFVPSHGLNFGRILTGHSRLAGINFTGSLATFQWLWSEVGLNIRHYETFPRLVGECGGKNFHLIHPSAHIEIAASQTIRSAFEYSGQKCSACSRLYVPASIWPKFVDRLIDLASSLKLGPAIDIDSTYLSAVIDKKAFDRITSYQRMAAVGNGPELELIYGGGACNEKGYYVQPTIYRTSDPKHRLMREEIFGPILSSVFAQDESFLDQARQRLRWAAGNLYLNDKSTGAVVGQQPFGGSKHSGTNDKAGGPHYLLRWSNQQTIKRTKRNLTKI